MFLKISQNSHENTCVRVSFLVKLQAGTKFYEILIKTPILQSTSERLPLYNNFDLPLWANVISHFKPGSLFRRHNMKGFYTISIDRNSYCKEGLLKSFSIFPLLITNKIGFLERSSLVCNNFVSCLKLGRPF